MSAAAPTDRLIPRLRAALRRRWARRPPYERSFVEPELLMPRPVKTLVTSWAVIALAAGGDAVNFYLALSTISAELSSELVALLVAALTVVAVACVHSAAVAVRERSAVGSTPWGAAPMALTVLWLLLGLTAFLLRLRMPEPDAGTGGLVVLGAEPVEASGGSVTLAMSLMMLVLYLATGGIAAWFAFEHHNPYARLYHRARRRARRAEKRLGRAVIREGRAERELAVLHEDLAHDDERASRELANVQARAAELHELARLRLAKLLGDPAATSALRQSYVPHPRVPDPVESTTSSTTAPDDAPALLEGRTSS